MSQCYGALHHVVIISVAAFIPGGLYPSTHGPLHIVRSLRIRELVILLLRGHAVEHQHVVFFVSILFIRVLEVIATCLGCIVLLVLNPQCLLQIKLRHFHLLLDWHLLLIIM